MSLQTFLMRTLTYFYEEVKKNNPELRLRTW